MIISNITVNAIQRKSNPMLHAIKRMLYTNPIVMAIQRRVGRRIYTYSKTRPMPSIRPSTLGTFSTCRECRVTPTHATDRCDDR